MDEKSRGPATLAAGAAAFAAAIAALVIAAHADQTFTQALSHCSSTATMPGYALPAAAASVLLMIIAAVLAVLTRRGQPASTRAWWRPWSVLLLVLAVAGILFTTYFGLIGVLADMGDKQSCFG